MYHFVMYLQNCLLKILRWASILVLLGYQYEQMEKQYTRSTHIYFILCFQVGLPPKKSSFAECWKKLVKLSFVFPIP